MEPVAIRLLSHEIWTTIDIHYYSRVIDQKNFVQNPKFLQVGVQMNIWIKHILKKLNV